MTEKVISLGSSSVSQGRWSMTFRAAVGASLDSLDLSLVFSRPDWINADSVEITAADGWTVLAGSSISPLKVGGFSLQPASDAVLFTMSFSLNAPSLTGLTVNVTGEYSATNSMGVASQGVVSAFEFKLDASGSAENQVLPAPDTESLVPGWGDGAHVWLPGDGNGDGKADSEQSNVVSNLVSSQDVGPQVGFVTFAAAMHLSSVLSAASSLIKVSEFVQVDVPSTTPAALDLPLALMAYQVSVQKGESLDLSVLVDSSTAANGFWQLNKQGVWVNLASAAYGGGLVQTGDKTQLNFVMTDGGEFDADGLANGIVVGSGGSGAMPLSLVGAVSDTVASADYWF